MLKIDFLCSKITSLHPSTINLSTATIHPTTAALAQEDDAWNKWMNGISKGVDHRWYTIHDRMRYCLDESLDDPRDDKESLKIHRANPNDVFMYCFKK